MTFPTSIPGVREWLDWLGMDGDSAMALPKAAAAMIGAIERAGAEHKLTGRQQAYAAIAAIALMLVDRPNPNEIDVLLDWADRNFKAVRTGWLDKNQPDWRSQEFEEAE